MWGTLRAPRQPLVGGKGVESPFLTRYLRSTGRYDDRSMGPPLRATGKLRTNVPRPSIDQSTRGHSCLCLDSQGLPFRPQTPNPRFGTSVSAEVTVEGTHISLPQAQESPRSFPSQKLSPLHLSTSRWWYLHTRTQTQKKGKDLNPRT